MGAPSTEKKSLRIFPFPMSFPFFLTEENVCEYTLCTYTLYECNSYIHMYICLYIIYAFFPIIANSGKWYQKN